DLAVGGDVEVVAALRPDGVVADGRVVRAEVEADAVAGRQGDGVTGNVDQVRPVDDDAAAGVGVDQVVVDRAAVVGDGGVVGLGLDAQGVVVDGVAAGRAAVPEVNADADVGVDAVVGDAAAAAGVGGDALLAGVVHDVPPRLGPAGEEDAVAAGVPHAVARHQVAAVGGDAGAAVVVDDVAQSRVGVTGAQLGGAHQGAA